MTPISRWGSRILWLVPGLLLAVFSVSKFQSGLAVDAAFPVPVYITMNVSLPEKSYAQAANILSRASDVDPKYVLARAEAIGLSGGSGQVIEGLLDKSLSNSPGSARGWLVLAETLSNRAPSRAAKALNMALSVAPYDYWIAGRRAADAARLHQYLDTDSRDMAKRQARLLWDEEILHPQIPLLLSTPSGAQLMTDAFQDDPDALRAMNRWLAKKQRERVRRQSRSKS